MKIFGQARSASCRSAHSIEYRQDGRTDHAPQVRSALLAPFRPLFCTLLSHAERVGSVLRSRMRATFSTFGSHAIPEGRLGNLDGSPSARFTPEHVPISERTGLKRSTSLTSSARCTYCLWIRYG